MSPYPSPVVTCSINNCERHAAKRLIVKLRQDHSHRKLMVTEDSLSSNASHLQVLQDHHLPDLLGGKEGDHAYRFKQGEAAEQAGRLTYSDRDDAERGLHHRFRVVSDMPLNESHADLWVNFLACWAWDQDTVQHVRWVTDLRVTKGTVSSSLHIFMSGLDRFITSRPF